MVEKLLTMLPAYLQQPDGTRAYLNLGRHLDGWQAAYVRYEGYALHHFLAFGDDPVEALILLKEQVDLLNLLNAPSTIKE